MAKSRIIAERDLRRMEEQLERHLDRLYGKRSNCHNEEWELDPKKLKVNNLIGQGAYGSVYKGVYDGKQVAGIQYAILVFTCTNAFIILFFLTLVILLGLGLYRFQRFNYFYSQS